MKVYDAYVMAIKAGMDADPRPESEVRKVLDDAKESYEKLDDDRKELFDGERLWNPYADSRFSALADEAREIEAESLMWGIDIGPAEVLLADRLREKGRTVSSLVAHHPIGTARTCFPEVMWMQTDMYADAGVPINVSEGLMKGRMDEVLRGVMGSNYSGRRCRAPPRDPAVQYPFPGRQHGAEVHDGDVRERLPEHPRGHDRYTL